MHPEPEIITYSLRGPDGTSDEFYRDLAAFTDEVLEQAEARWHGRIDGLKAWLLGTGRETPRDSSEYIYDCLTLGVLWTVHASRAEALPPGPRVALGLFSRLRRLNKVAETIADGLRGAISGLWLSRAGMAAAQRAADLPGLRQLHDWLEATGNFENEAPRISLLLDHLANLPAGDSTAWLSEIVEFIAWFDRRSLTALGRYTLNVDRFLRQRHPGHRWSADFVFTGRTRLEYHAVLAGHEILNRANRRAFLQTRQRLVLVPPCMRAQPEAECRAETTSSGAACRGCTPGCRVHQVTRLGAKHNFAVRIMPDELRVFSSPRERTDSANGLGIVGVSCALTNAPGGLETRSLGVPAQGVLLDYCGCSYHWHATGIPTDLNVRQLLRVMGFKDERGGIGAQAPDA